MSYSRQLALLPDDTQQRLTWLVKADHFFRMPTISDARQMQETVLEIIRMQASHGIRYNNPINPHWTQMVFTKPLLQPAFGENAGECQSLGPHLGLGEHRIPINSKFYIGLTDSVGVPRCRTLNHDTMSCMIFENSENKQAYVLLRVFRDDKPQFALAAAHELHVERVGSSLHLAKHNANEDTFAPWAVLSSWNWESLVLMYCTFLSLKASNIPTRQFCTEELCLQGEQKKFQAKIRGSGFRQILQVFREETSGHVRLHAVVQEGLLQQCPVWTIFVPDADSYAKAVASADTDEAPFSTPQWLTRVSSVKFHLACVQVHVFSQYYDARAQRKGPKGEFELEFISEESLGPLKTLPVEK
ncbi:hypothetical protein E4U32_006160 [Claviceps aff. humidiphila group G2b]|nr:hypothetical protein E4U32_006160 [Claviceps aff. humidiphila group G2b]